MLKIGIPKENEVLIKFLDSNSGKKSALDLKVIVRKWCIPANWTFPGTLFVPGRILWKVWQLSPKGYAEPGSALGNMAQDARSLSSAFPRPYIKTLSVAVFLVNLGRREKRPNTYTYHFILDFRSMISKLLEMR